MAATNFMKYVKDGGGRHSGDVVDIAVEQIEIEEGFNPRINDDRVTEHIRSIADSIIAKGFLRTEVLSVRFKDGHVFVRDGHCRLAAVRLAISEGEAIVTLPCIPLPKGADEVDEAFQVLTTQTKLPLTPLEWATQIKRLMTLGQSEAQIASRIGKRKDFIDRMLDLAGAAPEVREAVQAGQISPTEAVKVVRRRGSEAGQVIQAAVKQANAEGRSRARPRDVEKVTQPKERPPSIRGLAEAVVIAYRHLALSDDSNAMESLWCAIDVLAERFPETAKQTAD